MKEQKKQKRLIWLFQECFLVIPLLTVEIGQPVSYYPGVFRARAELEALENEFFPHVRFSHYGDDGMQHPGYRAAYEAALQKATSKRSEGKTFVEVKATVIPPPQNEGADEVSGIRMVVLRLDQRNGGEPHEHDRH